MWDSFYSNYSEIMNDFKVDILISHQTFSPEIKYIYWDILKLNELRKI
jgi:hypothetical protein